MSLIFSEAILLNMSAREYSPSSLAEKKIINVVSLELFCWAENDVKIKERYHSRDLLEMFKSSPDAVEVKHLQNLSQRKFNARIKMYADFKKWDVGISKSNGNQFFNFVEKEDEAPDWS